MKVLVTGCNGFVGPHLRQALLAAGHSVVGTSNTTGEHVDETADLLDQAAVSALVSMVRPDAIAHLAAQSSVALSWKEPDLTHCINVEGTKHLLDAARSLPTPPRILITSTAQVYGIPTALPVTEDHATDPKNPYARSKLDQEKTALQSGLSVVIARSFNHTGPGQLADFALPSFAKQIVDIERGKAKELLVGNLDATRDFLDVRDVVRAYIELLEKGTPGETYNVCSGVERTMRDILDQLIVLSDAPIMIKTDKDRMRPSDLPRMVGDHTKLTAATGWAPRIPFEQTLRDLLDHARTKSS